MERQKRLPVYYRGVTIDCAYRMDIVVGGAVIVEVKSVEALNRVHMAQMLCYLRLSGCHVGLLFNFNVQWLARDGVRRLVNGLPINNSR